MLITLALVVLLLIFVGLYFNLAPQLGGKATGKSLERMQSFEYYQEGTFQNTIETKMDISFSKMLPLMWKSFMGGGEVSPTQQIQVKEFNEDDSKLIPKDEIGMTWFGHSSVLFQMEGVNFLIDPVFSERSSMFSFVGPKRFDFPTYMSVGQLPKIDAVIISHDHYDHLDYETFMELKDVANKYYVPLGVAAHLEKWGVPSEQITEMEWWEEAVFSEKITLVCTPSRHFSGRGLTDRSSTLWSSWVFLGQDKRVYFSGDSGYTPEFKNIGEKYGPFDFAMMECGQYNQQWKSIHMMPEETAQAAIDINAKLMMPIHWGKFPLAFHAWYEPPLRMIEKAKELEMPFFIPEIGKTYTIKEELKTKGIWIEEYLD